MTPPHDVPGLTRDGIGRGHLGPGHGTHVDLLTFRGDRAKRGLHNQSLETLFDRTSVRFLAQVATEDKTRVEQMFEVRVANPYP